MTEKTHHVAESKKEIAKNIQKWILEYPIIAAVNMENLPAPQLQQMRAQLRGKIILTMTKRRIIKHAIEGIKDKKKNIEKIEPELKGMPALIFTKENPFLLFKTLKRSKTKAPAKAGQTAPFDIKVLKGPTSFAPGPIIGELAQLGIKSGVEGGKVAIKEDSIVVREGQKISAKTAEILARLGIEPMEVGLNVTAVYENGEIFKASILDIDEDKFKADLQKAASWALNLAVDSAYTTKETINTIIAKAFNDAKALGLSQEIIDEGIIDLLLGKAEVSALSLKTTANIQTVEKPKAKPTEKKTEKKHKEEPTPVEKREEKVLEEEKEIIEEEKKLEKEAKKQEIEAPVEKEIKEDVKEEEEMQLEKERIEKEKEFERVEEKKREAIKEKPQFEEKKEGAGTDKKIAEMVSKVKKFAKGEIPSAEKLVEEAGGGSAIKEKPEEKENPKVKKPQNIPSIQELKERQEKKKKQQEEVENLAQKLIRKGTLRK